jgi:hypothetical protein
MLSTSATAMDEWMNGWMNSHGCCKVWLYRLHLQLTFLFIGVIAKQGQTVADNHKQGMLYYGGIASVSV